MENKEDLDFSLKNIKITLDEVKKEYEYLDPVLNQNFTEFDHPVMDNEGFVREKYQYNVDKSILSQKRPVTIIESSDLKKIQKDHKTIEKRFDDMSQMFVLMMAKMDDQSRQIADQTKRMDALILENREQKQTIAGLKEDIALVSQQGQYQFNVMEDKLNLQATIMANQEKMLNSQAIKVESMEKFIQTLNETNTFRQFYRNKMKLHPDQREKLAFDDKNEMDSEFENVPLIDDKWMGQKHSPLTGMRDTFSIFTPSSVLTKEKRENQLRKMAFDGNLSGIQRLFQRDNSIVNGRGMPDSICSRTSEFFDKTALMLAAKEGHIDCVKFLLANGAEINYLDRDSFTALDYAQQNHHKEICDFLKKNYAVSGVDVLDIVKNQVTDEVINTVERVHSDKQRSYTIAFK